MRVGKWLLGLALLGGIQTATAATVEYYSDFESCAPSCGLTNGGGVESTQDYPLFHPAFGSLFWRNSTASAPHITTLSLSGLSAHTALHIDLLLAVIDSWDGTDAIDGTDTFNVRVDGSLVFSGTYTNFAGDEPYQGSRLFFSQPAFTSPGINDSAYLLSLHVGHTAPTATIEFFADGPNWTGGDNESWAIDNLSVLSEVPEPRSILLLLSGAAFLAVRLRRR